MLQVSFRALRPLSVVVLAAMTMAGLLPATTQAAGAGEEWCRIDDPATWRDRRQSGQGGCPAQADPQTLPEVLALPLPCGRQAVFQRIFLPTETLLDQRMVTVGMPAADDAPVSERLFNRRREQPLAGGFIVPADGERAAPTEAALAAPKGRAYYIGRYEVLEHHYRLLTDGLFDIESPERRAAACQDYDAGVGRMSDRSVYPAANVSWFDAVEFLRRWSAWLMAMDRARLAAGAPPLTPWEQGSPAYLRLPTEAEWEYAARGASPEDQEATAVYRVVDGGDRTRIPALEEIAAIDEGGRQRRRVTEKVGGHLPNLVGLYDTVGNVDEIVFDMFQLTRPDGLHGQFGGYVVKGGNRMTPLRGLSVAHRREVPFFGLSGETRSQTTGFRAVLAPPVIVGGAKKGTLWQEGLQNPALLAAFDSSLASISSANDADRREANDRLDTLRSQLQEGRVEAEALTEQVARIQDSLDRSNTRLNERDREIRRERLRSAAIVGFSISSMGANILSARNILKTTQETYSEKELAANKDQLEALESNIQGYEQSLASSLRFYMKMTELLAGEPPEKVVSALEDVRGDLEALKISAILGFVDSLESHIAALRAANGVLDEETRQAWVYQLDRTRAMRQQMFETYDK